MRKKIYRSPAPSSFAASSIGRGNTLEIGADNDHIEEAIYRGQDIHPIVVHEVKPLEHHHVRDHSAVKYGGKEKKLDKKASAFQLFIAQAVSQHGDEQDADESAQHRSGYADEKCKGDVLHGEHAA